MYVCYYVLRLLEKHCKRCHRNFNALVDLKILVKSTVGGCKNSPVNNTRISHKRVGNMARKGYRRLSPQFGVLVQPKPVSKICCSLKEERWDLLLDLGEEHFSGRSKHFCLVCRPLKGWCELMVIQQTPVVLSCFIKKTYSYVVCIFLLKNLVISA